ncbi:54S ribosomal protein L23, mitochondrial [Sorochytrium milnesiophthora]
MSQAVGSTALAYARVWHSVDVQNKVLGRIASDIACKLMGKHKPIYDPAADCGDYVVVTNAREIMVTGNKDTQKLYRYHTGYPGGLREIPFNKMMARHPEEIVRKAVSGMLPKNKLRDLRLSRLHIYPGKAHPYEHNIFKNYVQ